LSKAYPQHDGVRWDPAPARSRVALFCKGRAIVPKNARIGCA
jgi:hypothetical protein